LTDYRLEGFAADLAAVIESLNGPVVVAGWSMGVLVALTYARDYGLARVAGLALIGGTACPGTECQWFHGLDAASIAAEAQARADAMGLTEYADPFAVAGSWLSAKQADLRPMLGTLSVPALVIHGDRDDQCPVSHAHVLANGIPGAELDVLAGGGHHLPSQAPEYLARHLDRFVHQT
jgi:pimeloyl-ACP methyl ester carboxylesterase